MNFILFSINIPEIVDTVLENAKVLIDKINNGKNILVVYTNNSEIRNKIFSFIPDSVLDNTKVIHLIRNNDQGALNEPININHIKRCKNVHVVSMRNMNLTQIPDMNELKKIRYLDLKQNKISINFNDPIDLPKSLECLDLIDNVMKKRSVRKKNDCIIKEGNNVIRPLFEQNAQEVNNFLEENMNQLHVINFRKNNNN